MPASDYGRDWCTSTSGVTGEGSATGAGIEDGISEDMGHEQEDGYGHRWQMSPLSPRSLDEILILKSYIIF
jgi:hypothetical protein